MIPYLTEQFGNPASRSHAFGWTSEKAVEEARDEVAKLVNCDPNEIVWTSGATESINLALKGAAHFYKDKGKHLITVKTEHKAMLDTMRELEREGFAVTYLDVLAERPARSRGVQGRVASGYHSGVGDVRQQRDRRDPGHRGDRRDLPQPRDHFPCRRGAGDRQGADRSGHAQGRSDVVLGAQDLWSQRYRRAVRAAQAARADRGADARRRPRTRHAFGHAGDASDRRHG